jgi:hypothetical protein
MVTFKPSYVVSLGVIRVDPHAEDPRVPQALAGALPVLAAVDGLDDAAGDAVVLPTSVDHVRVASRGGRTGHRPGLSFAVLVVEDVPRADPVPRGPAARSSGEVGERGEGHSGAAPRRRRHVVLRAAAPRWGDMDPTQLEIDR